MSEIAKPEGAECRQRILLADDHSLMLERVTRFLQPTFEVVGMAHNGTEMVSETMRLNPDIIVADISMPELDGIRSRSSASQDGSYVGHRFPHDP